MARSMIRVLQIHIGEGRDAHDLMMETAKASYSDIIILSEPNKARGAKLPQYYTDRGGRAALVVVDERLKITKIGPGNEQGFRWLIAAGIKVYSCYWPPCISATDFVGYENFLDRLETRSGPNLVPSSSLAISMRNHQSEAILVKTEEGEP